MYTMWHCVHEVAMANERQKALRHEAQITHWLAERPQRLNGPTRAFRRFNRLVRTLIERRTVRTPATA
jgi:hypothetical protein